MKLWSDSFDGGAIATTNAFGKYNPESHVETCENRNPHLGWSDLPEHTRSLALICHDVDVPSSADNVNKEGVSVAADLARVDFYHWVLVDLAPESSPIKEGEFSDGITARGKPGPAGPRGTRQGLNNFTQWFADDADMAGDYFGYDGPCPPWNDEIVHHYHFTLYALDIDRCSLEGRFDGPALLQAIDGHVLAKASVVAAYAINPEAR